MSFWNGLNLKEIAQSQVNSTEYWFRRKYKLSPKDPRYLNCELWEMALELELESQTEALIRKEFESHQNLCSQCKTPLQGNVCPKCGNTVDRVREYYSDPDFAEYERKVEEESVNVDISKMKWVDVKDTDLDKMEEELS